MQSSENNQLNLDYAKEWIAFLRRRNLVLTIVWPFLLVLFVLSFIAAIYFYQQHKSSSFELTSSVEKNLALETKNKQLTEQLDTLESARASLEAELIALQNAREELSLQNNDSESKLNITSQMVDNLNQLVIELKNERQSLIEKLEDSEQNLSSITKQYEDYVASSKQENIKTISDLNKQLSSRKSAYQALANRQQEMREEMDRLSNLVSAKENQLQKSNKEKLQLKAEIKRQEDKIATYSNRLSALQEKYKNLEAKLSALTSPISSNETVKKPPLSAQNNNDISNITGLEEIKAPVKPKAASKEKNFDFDKITVLP